jgi:hypothetical protein
MCRAVYRISGCPAEGARKDENYGKEVSDEVAGSRTGWVIIVLAVAAALSNASCDRKRQVCLKLEAKVIENYRERADFWACLLDRSIDIARANNRNRPNKEDVDSGCRSLGGEVIEREDPDTACQKEDAERGVFVILFDDMDGDGYEHRHYGDGPRIPPEIWSQPSILLSMEESAALCQDYGGVWVDGATPYCRLSAAGIAVVTEDLNEDGLIGSDEAHCESLDENGEPSGEQVACF